MENTNGMKGRDTVKSNAGGRVVGGNNGVSSSQQSTTPQNTQTNSTLSTSSSVNTPNVNTPNVNALANNSPVKTEAVKPTNSPLFVKVTANSYEDNNNSPIATNDPRFGLEANRRWKEQKIAEKNEAQLNKNIDKQQKAISKMTTAITKNPDVGNKQTKGISPEKNLASSALEAGFENKPKKTTATVTTLPAKSSGEIINKSEIDAQNKRKAEVENAQKEYDNKVEKFKVKWDKDVEDADKRWKNNNNINKYYHDSIDYENANPDEITKNSKKEIKALQKQNPLEPTFNVNKADFASGTAGKTISYLKAFAGKGDLNEVTTNEGNFAVAAALQDKVLTDSQKLTRDEKRRVEYILSKPNANASELMEVTKLLEDKGYLDKNDRNMNYSRVSAVREHIKNISNQISQIRNDSDRDMIKRYAASQGDTVREDENGNIEIQTKDGKVIQFKKTEDGSFATGAGMYSGPDRYQTKEEAIQEQFGNKPTFNEPTIQPVYGNSVDSYTDVEGNVYNYNEQQQELRQKVADEFNEINKLYEEGQADIALQLGSELQQAVLNAVSQNAMSQEEASKYFYSIKQIGNEYIQNTYPNSVDTLVEWKQEELVKNDPALQVILQNENFLDAIKEREWQNATQSYVNGEISDNEYSSILNNLAEGGAQEAEKLAMETVGEMTPKKYKSFTELARAKADDVLTQYNVDESQLSYDDYSKLNKIGNTFGFKTFRDVVDTIRNAVKDVSNIALKIADVATLGLLHNKVFKNADKKVSNFFDKVNADTNSNYSQNLKEYATLYGTKEGQTYIQLCRNVKGLSLMGAGFVSFINGDAMTKTAATNMIKTGIGLIMNDVNGDPVERYLDNLAKDFGYDRFKSPNIQTVKPSDTTVSDKQFNSGTTSLDKKKRKTDEEELDSEMNEDTLESWNAGRGYTDEEIQKLIDSNYRNNDVAKNYAGSLRR